MVQNGRAECFLTSRNVTKDFEQRFSAVIPVRKPTDHCVEKDDKCGAQRAQEEDYLPPIRIPSPCIFCTRPNNVEHCQSSQAHRRIKMSSWEFLQGVYNHEIGRISGVDAYLSQHCRYLSGRNADR